MKELKEYKAEILRRSENRIRERKRAKTRILVLCASFCVVLASFSLAFLPSMLKGIANDKSNHEGEAYTTEAEGSGDTAPDKGGNDEAIEVALAFEFSLTWDMESRGSYDSATGVLTKESGDGTEFCHTEYFLTAEQLIMIRDMVYRLDIESYPDVYAPEGDESVGNTVSLTLTVKTASFEKTVNARLPYPSAESVETDLFGVCRTIADILTSTDEWNSLGE